MNKQEQVFKAMTTAMKNKDKETKTTLSLLLAALKNAEINKRAPLTEAEENAVVQKEIKQTKETLESAPQDRTDIIEECKNRLTILEQFAPKMLSEKEIGEIINTTLSELGLDSPTKKDKGKVMKVLMPKVRGMADGGQVNRILDNKLS